MESIKEEKAGVSNRERAAAKQELLDLLLEGRSSEEDLFGPEGVFTKLKGAVMEPLADLLARKSPAPRTTLGLRTRRLRTSSPSSRCQFGGRGTGRSADREQRDRGIVNTVHA